MFVRMTRVETAPDHVDEAAKIWEQQVLPVTRLQATRVPMPAAARLPRRPGRRCWRLIDSSDAGLGELRREGGQTLGAEQVKVENFEALFVELNVPAGVSGA